MIYTFCRYLFLLPLLLTSIHGAASQQAASTVAKSHESILEEFLVHFDKVSARGFVKTLRPGDTGVGYTLETLLEIPENNSPRGDFQGMEIKAYRDSETEFDDQDKMNLFLKEPEWLDSLTTTERIRQYGYKDPNGRQAWYLSVTRRKNEANLQLVVTGQGDVLEPEDAIIGIGSGGNYALSAARALLPVEGVEAEEICRRAMKIAADICVYTNGNIILETLAASAGDAP